MARLFDDASSEYGTADSPPVTAVPFTIASWFKTDIDNANQAMVAIADSSVAQHWLRLGLSNTGVVQANARDGGTNERASATAGYSTGTWGHACGVFASTTSRTVYFNGGNSATNTNSVTPAGIDRMAVGTAANSLYGTTLFMSGDLGEVGIWDVALSATDVALLAKGFAPPMVRPASLVWYAPLIGRTSPEIELISGNKLTLINSPAASPHPPILYPSFPMVSFVVMAAGGTAVKDIIGGTGIIPMAR